MDSEDIKFCSNCYYLIGVRGDPSVHEDLVIIDSDFPIPLKDGSNFKDKVKEGEKKTYEFYDV